MKQTLCKWWAAPEAAPGAEKQRALLFYDLYVTRTQPSNQPNQFLHSSFRLEQLNLFTCLFL